MEGVHHAHRRRVVIDALFAEIAADQRHVEVPALYGGAAALHACQGAGAEADRRQARGARQTLLGAGVGRVDPPLVDSDVHTR